MAARWPKPWPGRGTCARRAGELPTGALRTAVWPPGSVRSRPELLGVSVAGDDFALGAAGVDVLQRRHGVGEVEDAIDDGPQRAGLDECGDLAQLRPVGTHEEERVGRLVAARQPPDLVAERHHRAQRWLAELAGEGRVGRSADADDQPAG